MIKKVDSESKLNLTFQCTVPCHPPIAMSAASFSTYTSFGQTYSPPPVEVKTRNKNVMKLVMAEYHSGIIE